jgi:hypothetical protein
MLKSTLMLGLVKNVSLRRGCGGVGFMWRKTVNATLTPSISSDRICGLCVKLLHPAAAEITIFGGIISTLCRHGHGVLQWAPSWAWEIGVRASTAWSCGDLGIHWVAREVQVTPTNNGYFFTSSLLATTSTLCHCHLSPMVHTEYLLEYHVRNHSWLQTC